MEVLHDSHPAHCPLDQCSYDLKRSAKRLSSGREAAVQGLCLQETAMRRSKLCQVGPRAPETVYVFSKESAAALFRSAAGLSG